MDGVSVGRADEILTRAAGLKILVVGDVMLDRYVRGSVDRVSPEAPVPVVRVGGTASAVGGAGNVAANVTALGAGCAVVGVVGDDAAADEVGSALEALGVDVAGLVRDAARPTTVKTRVLAGQHQIVRYDVEAQEDTAPEISGRLADVVAGAAAGSDAIAVEDYNKGALSPPVIEATRAAAGEGTPWVVDPKRRNFFAYAGATLFKPNARELQDALGDFIHPDDPAWLAAQRERLECGSLLLTLGDRGMALSGPDGDYLRIPAAARGVYDVSGAGDTVTAVVSVALAAGASPGEAAWLANQAAAIGVARPGVSPVTVDELRRRLHGEAGEAG